MRASGSACDSARKLASTRSTSSTRHGVAGFCSARNRAIFGVIAPHLPLLDVRLVKATDVVDETVERTSDLNELPERLTSLRNHEGQRHVRCCVSRDIGPPYPSCKH